MEANELRLGNKVYLLGYDSNEGGKFLDGSKEEMEVDILVLKDIIEDSEFYKPIPLTADWLLKFGFSHLGIGFVSVDDLFFAYAGNDGKYEIFLNKEVEEDVYLAHIQYVHQLQNLYFVLTGKELTIK